jgi:hypothetical protein
VLATHASLALAHTDARRRRSAPIRTATFAPDTAPMMGGRKITGRYRTSTGPKQQAFGRLDPLWLFAVLPMLIIARLVVVGAASPLGVVVLALALLVVLVDAWVNRPIRNAVPRDRKGY